MNLQISEIYAAAANAALSPKKGASFSQALDEAIQAKEMSDEEYKLYIYNRIACLPINPSRMADSISVNISDEGFKAMKNDPEYEEWVIGVLKRDWMTYNPWAAVAGGNMVVYHIGASKEEYRVTSAPMGTGKKECEKPEKGFWENREHMAELLELHLKKLEQTELLEHGSLARAIVERKMIVGEDIPASEESVLPEAMPLFPANLLLSRGKFF